MEFLTGCLDEKPKKWKGQDESRKNKHQKIKKE